MRQLSIGLLIAMLLPVFSQAGIAGESPEYYPYTQTARRDIAEFVTPDGHIDLAALRESGYEGPLEFDGMDIQVDQLTGEPVVNPFAVPYSEPDYINWDYHFLPPFGSNVTVSGHPDDIYWKNEISSYSRIDNSVICSVVYEDQLILAGAFTHAGVTDANHVVSWDGKLFSPLGLGTSDTVTALTVYNGKLIVAGMFESAGGMPASHIASWDGSSWSALGDGINGHVMSLTVIDNVLVAGGDFTKAGSVAVHSVAKWDGTEWSAVGSNLAGQVNALIVYDDRLYAGGSFVVDADSLQRNFAYWDSDEWRTVVDSLSIPVRSMVAFDDKLIVSGYVVVGFWTINITYGLMASWDGSNWVDILSNLGHSVGGLHNDFACTALAVHDNQLLAGGFFFHSCFGGYYYEYALMRWSGTSWDPFVDGLIYPGIRILIDYDGGLVAGGSFWSINGVMAFNAASLKGSDWYQLGGLEYRGTRLTIFDNKLISAGRIVNGSSNYANDYDGEIRLEAWDGSSWSDYGPPFEFSVYGDVIDGCGGVYRYPPAYYAAIPFGVYDDKLIIESYPYSGDQLYSWDEFTVSPLAGLSAHLVKTLIPYHDNLIVAGNVEIGDYKGIAMWDGNTWSDMGISREDFIPVYPVYTIPVLTVFDDKLVLNSCDETDHKLQVWDGNKWSYLGNGEHASIDSVLAMTTYNSTLIAGGSFATAGALSVNNIAFWNGESWQPVGGGLNGPVTALAVYDGRLIAGGTFTEAGGQPANNIAAWDGYSWSSLGSGVNGEIKELLVYHKDLVVSGNFSTAGEELSPFISVWTKKVGVNVTLDIRPGSCVNPINGNSAHGQGKAVLPVAIMGSPDFDVHDIDLATLTLNGTSPVRWNYQDVGAPPDDPDEECACSEAGPDGYTDLCLKFYSADIVASLNGSNVVSVEGQLNDGSSFEGQDCVTPVGHSAMREVASDTQERGFEVIGNYPNPFNPSTKISFYLPDAADVKLEIFNILGQRVSTLIDRTLEAGEHSAIWDGSKAASGVYYYRLTMGGQAVTKRMLLLK